MQDCSNSIANALELLESYTKLSIYYVSSGGINNQNSVKYKNIILRNLDLIALVILWRTWMKCKWSMIMKLLCYNGVKRFKYEFLLQSLIIFWNLCKIADIIGVPRVNRTKCIWILKYCWDQLYPLYISSETFTRSETNGYNIVDI